MANTVLTQTWQEVQAILNKSDKLPTLSGSDNGKTLQVNSSGNIVANTVSSGGTQLYKHIIYYYGTNSIIIVSTSNTPVTNAQSAAALFGSLVNATLYFDTPAEIYTPVLYIGYASQTSIYVYYFNVSNTAIQSIAISITDIFGNDTVTTL